MDYFTEAIIPDGTDGYRPDIIKTINKDIISYRRHMIKQYNNDEQRATDEFCFTKFLNDYTTAINVFGLHKELNCKSSFNGFINSCWDMINGKYIEKLNK